MANDAVRPRLSRLLLLPRGVILSGGALPSQCRRDPHLEKRSCDFDAAAQALPRFLGLESKSAKCDPFMTWIRLRALNAKH